MNDWENDWNNFVMGCKEYLRKSKIEILMTYLKGNPIYSAGNLLYQTMVNYDMNCQRLTRLHNPALPKLSEKSKSSNNQ